MPKKRVWSSQTWVTWFLPSKTALRHILTAGAFGYWHSVVGLGVNVGEVSIEAAKATIRVLAGVQSSTKVRVTPCGHSLSSEPQEANSIGKMRQGQGLDC
ncbi:MAG: hypothetical protein WBV90_00010, partial [Terrimicrobiaceae bacterium]